MTVAAAVPIALSAAWIPLRDRLPNTDLALVLVVIIGIVGWVAGARPSLVAAIGAAAAFDLLDARPYGTLSISRGEDVATAGVLMITGLLAGVVAARLARYRRSENRRSDALAVVMEASGLVATGEEQRLITHAMSTELIRALDLVACELHSCPPNGTRPAVARDGNLIGLLGGDADQTAAQIDLPVWRQGEVVAHYRLTIGAKKPSRHELRVALSLADQAGAAMAGPAHPEPPPDRPAQLRQMPSTAGPEPVAPGDAHIETPGSTEARHPRPTYASSFATIRR